MSQRTISTEEHLQLVGLVTIARIAQTEADRAADLIKRLIGDADDDGSVYDVVVGDRDLEWLLERFEITVATEPQPDPLREALAAIRDASDTSDGPPESPVNRLCGIHQEALLALGEEDRG